MRIAILASLAIALSSCSKTVDLLIENRSGTEVTITSDNQSFVIDDGKVQKIPWPDPKHTVSVSIDQCIQNFDLDEFYTPWNDWRDQSGKISRRYVVGNRGELAIVRPGAAHVAYTGLKDEPVWQTKNLSPLSEQCR